MTLSITAVGQAMDATGILLFGAVAAVILIVVWALVAVGTVRLLRMSTAR